MCEHLPNFALYTPAPSLGFDTAGWAVHTEGESQSVAPTHRPLGLVEVLKAARDGELDGQRYRIVHYPDWGCLGELLTLEQPGHPNACVCPVPGEDWKLFGYNPQPERPLSFFPTPLADYFQIFESDLDVGYDVSHCTKEVVVNMGLHGIDFSLQDQHAKHPG